MCVLLCDNHEIPRAAIAGMLALEPDIEVVGEAANGAETVDLARVLRPDVTIMDLKMPVMDGFDAMRIACSRAALARLHQGDSARMGEAKVLLEGPNRVSGPTYIHDKRLFQPPLNDSGSVLS